MNNKQYELIGESIWNTYSDIANIIQGQRQDEGKVIDKVKAVAKHIKDVVLKKKPLRSTYKDNERKVLEAIKILFNSIDEIEIFNKKAIYLYLREITGLNTKQVVNNLNKLRKKYRVFKNKWESGEI